MWLQVFITKLLHVSILIIEYRPPHLAFDTALAATHNRALVYATIIELLLDTKSNFPRESLDTVLQQRL
jgi:hypothetical protein